MTYTNRPVVEEANGAHPYPGTTAEDFIKRAAEEEEAYTEYAASSEASDE